MGAEPTAGADGLLQFLTSRSLPVARRGYDQEATDSLLSQLEEGLEATIRQHEETRSHLVELERRISEGQEREEAVTEALVVATQIKADSERQGQEIKDAYGREGEAMKEEARQKAGELVREAEAKAETVLHDAQLKVQGFEQEIRDTERLAVEARARLRDFLESLLAELEPTGAPLDTAVDDLLARAGQLKVESAESAQLPRAFADGGPSARGEDGSPPSGEHRA